MATDVADSGQMSLFRTASHRSLLRYPGGKFRAIKVLDELIPDQISTVLSPFVGGGSYELHLTRRDIQVAAFDGFPPLVNFWTHLLTSPDALADHADALRPLTAPSFRTLRQQLSGTCESISDAAAYLAVNRSSFSGATMSGGFSQASADTRFNDALIARVRGFWNPSITVSHGLFEDTLTSGYDLIFADPPYLLDDSANKLYGDGGNMHESFDHATFHEIITAITSPWLITYNDSPALREMYADYDIQSVSWAYGMNASKESSEIVIRNY